MAKNPPANAEDISSIPGLGREYTDMTGLRKTTREEAVKIHGSKNSVLLLSLKL